MTILMSGTIGLVFAAGVYLLLQRSLLRAILGIVLLGNGANLVIFTGGQLHEGIPIGRSLQSVPNLADPVPQALILTAIVIGLGLVAFFLVLGLRSTAVHGSDDLTALDREQGGMDG